MTKTRQLRDLRGVGPRTVDDFEILGVRNVAHLAECDPGRLFERLCQVKRVRIDPCQLDVFHCAVAQARNPRLPSAQRDWWWWSRRRKAAGARG